MLFSKFSFYCTALIFTILLILPTQFSSSFAEDEYVSYAIPLQGLILEYPDKWYVIDEDLSDSVLVMFYLTDESETMLANIVVSHIGLEDEINSFDAADEIVDGMTINYPDLRIEQEGTIQIDDHSSREKIISYNVDSTQLKQHIVVTAIENSVYTFMLSTTSEDYIKYKSTFNNVLNSIEIKPETIPQPVDRIYVDDVIKAEFPENWITMKSVIHDDDTDTSMDMIMSFSPIIANGGIDNLVGIFLGYLDNDTLIDSYFTALENSGCYLTTDYISIVKLNNMDAMEFEMNCIPDGFDDEIESTAYVLISEESTFLLYYMTAEKHYENYFNEFEKFKESVHLKNTLDLSDSSVIANVYGMDIKEEHLKISSDFNLPIMLYDGSTIQNFEFDAESAQVSFQPVLNFDEFFQIDIEIDELLESPYSVDVNGEYADFFIIDDKTVDKTTISIFAESPTDTVTIKGKLHENLMESNVDIIVPTWIKTNAEFWAQDKIDDSTFISGIQFLIKTRILDVPSTSISEQVEQTNEIPTWIKTNAEFWAQDLISDGDFLNGIQYLVENGIIKV